MLSDELRWGGRAMSYLVAVPDMLASAATDVEGIGSSLTAATAAAAAPTTAVAAAGANEVSTAIAALFSGHAQAHQALSAEAAAFHTQFVRALTGAADAYTGAEAANAAPLQSVVRDALDLVNAPGLSGAISRGRC
jgi:PE family